MQLSRNLILLIKIITVWSVLILLCQYLTYLLGAEYDSKNGGRAVLWWITQILSFPIWCISEAGTLVGLRLRGIAAYTVITTVILALSITVLARNRSRNRTEHSN